MRRILLLLSLAALNAWGASDEAVQPGVETSVFRVHAVSAEGRKTEGSAVMIATDTLVTNCHLTKGAETVAVARGGTTWHAESQMQDVHHDLCVLHVPGAAGKAPDLRAAGSLQPGEKVYSASYGGGSGIKMSAGEVSALRMYEGGKVIQNTAAFAPGAGSGGGLFDAKGRLVGIVTFQSGGNQPVYFALPLEWLESSTATGAAGRPGEEPDQAFWQLEPTEQPYFLRAGRLEREKSWEGLLNLSREWAQNESDNADAWLAYAKSCANLRRKEEAMAALHRAVSLDPAHLEAWQWLFEVYKQMSREIEV